MVFHWSLNDSKSPQFSTTRLRILAVLSNAVISIVSIRLPTAKYSQPFNDPLYIVPKAPLVKDSSLYSGRSHLGSHLDSLYPFANLQVLQAF